MITYARLVFFFVLWFYGILPVQDIPPTVKGVFLFTALLAAFPSALMSVYNETHNQKSAGAKAPTPSVTVEQGD